MGYYWCKARADYLWQQRLCPHPPLHSMGELTIGNMLMGRSCRGYWGVNNEKFLQEVPFNKEIHRAEILLHDDKKLQSFLNTGNGFTESDSWIHVRLAINDQKNLIHTSECLFFLRYCFQFLSLSICKDLFLYFSFGFFCGCVQICQETCLHVIRHLPRLRCLRQAH